MTEQPDTLNEEGVDDGDPTEEVGPEGAQVQPEECEIDPGARSSAPEASQIDAQEELQDAFEIEPSVMVAHPSDGLPVPAEEAFEQTPAPPFTYETVVCVGDDREYVELFASDAAEGVDPEEMHVDPSEVAIVVRSRWTSTGVERTRRRYPKARVIERWGASFVEIAASEVAEDADTALQANSQPGRAAGFVFLRPVRPLRPACRFYKRQIFSNDDQPDPTRPGSKILFRNCTKRRSVGGAFMSLRDQAVFACDYRDPPDPGSVKRHLDVFDENKLATRPHEILVPLWGADAGD